MAKKPDRQDIKRLLEELRRGVHNEACWTCDCIQGLLAQLEMDAAEDVADLIAPWKVPRERMHGCLGCQPCVGGEVFSDYLRRFG